MPHSLRIIFVFSTMLLLVGACNDADDTSASVDVRDGAQSSGCQGPEDCPSGTLCVATEGDSDAAQCVDRCSIEDGDVCPVGEYCAKVIGMSGDAAAACIEGSVQSQKSWQTCANHDECTDGESCVDLDGALGARCIPMCDLEGNCANPSDECALHWDGDDGAQSGCVRQCVTAADCETGWHCQRGDAVSGICVR